MKCFEKDKLSVKIFENRDLMGADAAKDVANCIRALQKEKAEINMIFAAAPSQNDLLAHLCEEEGIDWGRINAFHMDEYIGLDPNAPQCFSNFLKRGIFDKKPFGSVNLINAGAEKDAEIARYAALLKAHPIDIVCMGIGENGHIAFNDPHVADFNDPALVKAVSLDEKCRQQQVNDGCFASIDLVPKYAMTLTVPMLMSATYKFCVVPAPTKAWAVNETVNGAIGETCPATVMRISDNCILYCDADSAALLK